jgi:hypothetical protein
MYNAKTPGEAAAAFVTGYLKPAQQFQEARANKYLGTTGDQTAPASYADSTPSSPHNADLTPAHYQQPRGQQPYPDALNRDWGQKLARSPWLSLVKAGAAMASTTGPVGTAIAHGMAAGAGELDSQRKSLQTEEGINQRAQGLYQQAMTHLDSYQRMTPYQEAIREQGKFQVVNYTDQAGNTRVGRFDTKHGTLTDQAGQPVDAGRVTGRSGNSGGLSPASAMSAAQKLVQDPNSEYFQRDPVEVAHKLQGSFGGTQTIAAPSAAPSAATAQPDPGPGQRVKGMWYIGPTGKPQQWNG